jgi:hypothetical protein
MMYFFDYQLVAKLKNTFLFKTCSYDVYLDKAFMSLFLLIGFCFSITSLQINEVLYWFLVNVSV